jgi:four helix bundle protein
VVFADWKACQLAFQWPWTSFPALKSFPEEERYSLTSQIRHSSCSLAAKDDRGLSQARLPSVFVGKLADSDAKAAETPLWLDIAQNAVRYPWNATGIWSPDTKTEEK